MTPDVCSGPIRPGTTFARYGEIYAQVIVDPAGLVLATCTPLKHPVSAAELRPVTSRRVDVLLAPGGSPVGVQLEPGFELPATRSAWLHVRTGAPVTIDGWVPASARGWSWQVPEPMDETTGTLGLVNTPVHTTRDDAAPAIAWLDGRVRVHSEGVLISGEWAFLVARTPQVRVAGYVRLPALGDGRKQIDFEDDTIEDELPRPARTR
jgi:hypothetical protein